MKIIFLGTGGGRFVTIGQARSTGGIYIIDGKSRVHIDPGPGALVRMHEAGLDPGATGALLVSHCHPDHYIDAEILIEAMTSGCNRKRGLLFASRSILSGEGGHGPAVSQYHQGVVGQASVACCGASARCPPQGIRIEAIPAFHSDSSGVGFRLRASAGDIVWGSDTRLCDGIMKGYAGARILILSVTTPLGIRIPYHLNTEDAAEVATQAGPELAVITHFGVKMLKSDVRKQAMWIEEKSGIPCIAASDGMEITVSGATPGNSSARRRAR